MNYETLIIFVIAVLELCLLAGLLVYICSGQDKPLSKSVFVMVLVAMIALVFYGRYR